MLTKRVTAIKSQTFQVLSKILALIDHIEDIRRFFCQFQRFQKPLVNNDLSRVFIKKKTKNLLYALVYNIRKLGSN